MTKARPSKYIRKIPDGKGGFRYIYKEKERRARLVENKTIESLVNSKESTDFKTQLIHFSDGKISEFETKERGAVYFFEKPQHGFIDESGEYDDILEEKEKSFGDKKEAKDELMHPGWYYGDYANIVDVHSKNTKILDLRKYGKKDFDQNEWLVKNVDSFKHLDLEDDETEIEEKLSEFYDNKDEIEINKKAKQGGFDIVLYDDQSEGTPYTSIAVVNPDIIGKDKKLQKAVGFAPFPQLKNHAKSEKILSYIRKNKSKTKEYAPLQIAIGIQVEMEHTDNPKYACRIAKDHLDETSDYYTKHLKSGLVDESLELTDEIVSIIKGETMKKTQLIQIYDNVYVKLEKSNTTVEQKIVAFIKKNPGVTDDDFHDFLESIGVDHREGEEIAYEAFGDILNKAGQRKLFRRVPKKTGEGYDLFSIKGKRESSELKKAKKVPIGTVSKGRRKVAEGKWVPVSEKKGPQKDEKPKGKKDKKPDQKKEKQPEGKTTALKGALKKMATILADMLSGRDVNQPTGAAIEEAGESAKNKVKPKKKTSEKKESKPESKKTREKTKQKKGEQ